MKGVVLVSGGMDSATVLAQAIQEGGHVYPLMFDYGQRHSKETDLAMKQIEHWQKGDGKDIVKAPKLFKLDLRQIGGSALTDDIDVPEGDEGFMQAAKKVIPITYVPARNTIMLSLALGYAETLKAEEIWHGANYVDYSGYPDCRPEYFKALQLAFNLATKMTVPQETGGDGMLLTLRTPLIFMSKEQIVEAGQQLKVPWQLTWSCYKGEEKACGVCPSCVLRIKGFFEAGVPDPLPYAIEIPVK